MKIIVLVGIPGVGKSSILQEVVRQIPTISVENYGDQMLKEAALEGITRSFLTACSMHIGSLLCRIQNNSPSLKENVLPFIRLIQSF